ncbi:hypothetical protein DTO212C5_269 [Paecilomyces variotii]|nr:hypothetical protein DTO212C5_269 [Paecilomyces variotii]
MHHATGFNCGDEMGLLFDQYTCKAAFVELFDDVIPICDNGYGWKPLEEIYGAYLEMIKEGKIEACTPDGKKSKESRSDAFGPWIFNDYTTFDIQKSVEALKYLLDVIEAKRSSWLKRSGSEKGGGNEKVSLPWTDPAILDIAGIQQNTFAREFCEESAKWTRELSFRYIAPGIRIPTVEEFIAQPFNRNGQRNTFGQKMHVLLFQADNGELFSNQTVPIPNTWLNYNGCTDVPITTGLYLIGDHRMNQAFENSCQLLLPFMFGANGWARLSDNEVMGMEPIDDEPSPLDVNSELYQSGYNGFFGSRQVQLHKVLTNWADRVKCGDWTVNEAGVEGGIEKFREADTEANWQKHWLPLTW